MKKTLMLALIMVLSACASDKDSEDKASKENLGKPKEIAPEVKFNTDNLICPQVAILTKAQQHLDYGGENPDPSQLVATAHMDRVDGDCAYRPDGVDIDFTLHMSAKRGPRLGGDQTSIPFFIASIDPAENILSREIITATFIFKGQDKVTQDDEALHVFIPIKKEDIQAGPAYRVLMGFKK